MVNDDGYRTRDIEVGHVVTVPGDDDDWVVIELVTPTGGGRVVCLRNADGTEHLVQYAEEHLDDRVWNVVRQPDEDLFND